MTENRRTQLDAITLMLALILLLILEYTAGFLPADWPGLLKISLLRLVQCSVLLGLLYFRKHPPLSAGLSLKNLEKGIKTGILGCFFMGVAALSAGLALHFYGINPLPLIHVHLPDSTTNLILFFIAGGLIAPVAEELFFRGFIFSYLKKYGFIPALLISTSAFAILHSPPQPTQWIGGLVFGLAYGLSGSLAAPVIIHACGNLVLFSLSWMTAQPFFHALIYP
ncbi:CPBP family intramembrane glutamic endopeptidase [Desulfobotulus mexicanus]|uniref:CPBP family intramembrane metalloprotease n=1 Tax=Desulfobotulus mexicanus TaxID=2586642 RepID=A0A5Q4VGI0_9BACT|nr:type II CAAX endopeptidase family protein [Desulfobotulus mexicanus]TYT75091.1 CPBP family intramembrane metalloprotease [Desulfobotulus mexicanus]